MSSSSSPVRSSPADGIVGTARTLADEVLFPAALDIDRAPVVPAAMLDRLADEGLYGLYGPKEAGGLDVDPSHGVRVIEALAGGSLTTTFVWIQHHSALRAVAGARPAVRERWLAPLCAGRLRAGIAYGALRRTGPAPMTAQRVEGGWAFTGNAPWVTGWDRIGMLYVAARHDDDIVWALVDARAGRTLRARPAELAAVASSSTVVVDFTDHLVPGDHVVGVEAFSDWQARDRRGLATNGYLAIGVAARCARLLGDGLGDNGPDNTVLIAEVDEARRALDDATEHSVLAARAGASLLAVRAASALIVAGGGRSIELDHHAQRLGREALFLLVFGQTSDIKAEQLGALLAPG